jgi:hypothetical protein
MKKELYNYQKIILYERKIFFMQIVCFVLLLFVMYLIFVFFYTAINEGRVIVYGYKNVEPETIVSKLWSE